MELNERQYIEADAVLSLLEGRLWMSLRELSEEMVVWRGASRSDYRAAMAALHRLRLIENFPGTAGTVALTGEGEKALAVGLCNYENRKNRVARVEKICSWVAFVCSLATLAVAVATLLSAQG